MINTLLEQTYIIQATQYIVENISEDQAGQAIGWIMYGLNMREQEVADLKQRITELGG